MGVIFASFYLDFNIVRPMYGHWKLNWREEKKEEDGASRLRPPNFNILLSNPFERCSSILLDYLRRDTLRPFTR